MPAEIWWEAKYFDSNSLHYSWNCRLTTLNKGFQSFTTQWSRNILWYGPETLLQSFINLKNLLSLFLNAIFNFLFYFFLGIRVTSTNLAWSANQKTFFLGYNYQFHRKTTNIQLDHAMHCSELKWLNLDLEHQLATKCNAKGLVGEG